MARDDEQQAARFSPGELVVIDAPGWLWDCMVATAGNAWRAGRDQRWLYNVTINWPNGDSRIYTLWETQLTSANDDESCEKGSGGDGA